MSRSIFGRLLTDVRGRRSTWGAEVRGGVATFLTMAYILPVNAGILSNAVGTDKMPALVATTALAAGVCCLLMGFIANFPIALASGMGLNALVAFTVAKQAGSWQAGMGLVVLEGLVILALVALGLREAVMRAIPRELRLAIGAGIGLFIALIGLQNAGLVVHGEGALLKPGDVHRTETLVACAGVVITAVLMAWRLKGALLIGIAATTLIALAVGVAHLSGRNFAAPTFGGVIFEADVRGALKWELLPVLFAILMVDFFDTLGTASAIAEEGELADENGNIPGVRRVLLVDSAAATIGGLFGVSSNTCYIESAAGVAEGARTGLHTVVVGALFLLAIFASPLLAVVPKEATAPALILVGFFMMRQVSEIDFDDVAAAVPAFVTLLTIPATFSIAHGIGFGVLTYVAIQVCTLRWRSLHPLMLVVAAAFAAYFVWAPHG